MQVGKGGALKSLLALRRPPQLYSPERPSHCARRPSPLVRVVPAAALAAKGISATAAAAQLLTRVASLDGGQVAAAAHHRRRALHKPLLPPPVPLEGVGGGALELVKGLGTAEGAAATVLRAP